MSNFILADILKYLNMAAMEHLDDGSLHLISPIPTWFKCLFPDAAPQKQGLNICNKCPFIESFLADAKDFWVAKTGECLKSGIWIEIDSDGNEYALEATAISMGKTEALLIELAQYSYDEKQFIIQKGRELRLAHNHLQKMEDALRESEEQLREHSFLLEDLVKQRTDELAKANKELRAELMQRQKTEDILKESIGIWQDTFDAMVDGIAVVYEDGTIARMNESFAQLHGYELPEKLIGRPLLGFIAEKERARIKRVFEELAEKEISVIQDIAISHIRKDGSIFPALLNVVEWRHQGGKVLGNIVVVRDITERRQIENELARIEKLESIGVLAGGIAHDFNNILTGIMGNISIAEMYVESGRLPREILDRLKEANRASKTARDLTQQLLTFSKGGAPILQEVNIGILLENSASFATRGTNAKCEFFIQSDLWSAEVDEGQVNQVINNIIINASQAMPEGGAIRIYAENAIVQRNSSLPIKSGIYVKISIADQGVGIPEEHLQRVFDPFFTTKQSGSGLGLATSYSIIQKHDGYVSAESEIDVGTTFHLYLPATSRGTPIIDEKKEEKPLIGTGKILVMDDEKYIRDLLAEMLNSIGYEVVTSIKGSETIDIYKEAMESGELFDAVILDLTIPGEMGGMQVIQRLKVIDTNVKAIVSSGYSDDPVLANFAEYGFKGAMAKPYITRELSVVLNRIINDS